MHVRRCTGTDEPPCTQVQVPVTLYVIPFISYSLFDSRSHSLDLIPPSNSISPSTFTSKSKLLWRIDIFRSSSFEPCNWPTVQLDECATSRQNLDFKLGMYKLMYNTSLFVHGCRVQMTSQQFFGETFVQSWHGS